jgi:hypothetical protein
MIFLAFCIGFIACAFLVLLIVLSWPVRHPPMPTKYARRHLFSELKEGIDAPASTRGEPPHHRKHRDAAERRLSREGREGIDYKFLGMGDREDVR